jgi:hypothetical protein
MKTNYSDWTPRSFMDEFFSPVKYSYGNVEGQGTKDNPYVITRRKVVDTTYHGWYDDDGSYHETPVKEKNNGN